MITLTETEQVQAFWALVAAKERASFPLMAKTYQDVAFKLLDGLVPVLSPYEATLVLSALMAERHYESVRSISERMPVLTR